jgi:hypothetical protein
MLLKKLLKTVILWALLSSPLLAQVGPGGFTPRSIQSVTDGTNTCYPYQIKVGTNSCSNGVATISTGGGSGTNYWVNSSSGNVGIGTIYNISVGTTAINSSYVLYDQGNAAFNAGNDQINQNSGSFKTQFYGNNGLIYWSGSGPGAQAAIGDSSGDQNGTYVEADDGAQLITISKNVQVNGGYSQQASGVNNFESNVGINSTVPGQYLDIQGTARMTGFTLSTSPSSGYVLTSDTNGNGTWKASSGGGGVNYWIQTANIGIGTGYNVGIGSLVPGATLDVNGNIRVNSTTNNFTLSTNSSKDIIINANSSASTGADERISIGGGITNAGNNSIAEGWGANGTGYFIAIGYQATATGNGTCYGFQCTATTNSVGIGGGGTALNSGTYVGYNAGSNTGVAAGNAAQSLDDGSAIYSGGNVIGISGSSSDDSNGMGYDVQTGNFGVAFGTKNQAMNVGSFAIASDNSILNGGLGPAICNQNYSGELGPGTCVNGDLSWLGLGIVNSNGFYLYPIQTSNSNNSYFTGGGNVGIGTTIPPSPLYVKGVAEMTGFKLDGNGVSAGFVLQTNSVGVGTWVPNAGTPGGINGNVQYNSSGTFAGSQKLFFDGTNLGIGTNLPVAGLDVENSGNAFFGGNVGIGSVNPIHTLDITTANTTNSQVGIGNLEVQGYALNNNYILDNSYYNGSNFITRATGYSGAIALVAPEMQIRECSSTSGGSNICNSGVGYTEMKVNADGTVAMGGAGSGISTTIGTYTGASMIVANTGNVGIGSIAPGQKLDVNGSIRALTTGACSYLYKCVGGVDAGVIQTSACNLCPAGSCTQMNLCG